MQGKSVAGAALAIAALLVVSAPAVARLDGAERQSFIESSLKSCSEAVRKGHPTVAAATIKTYCSCMADAEADMTTDADVQYMDVHNEASPDYRSRVLALAPACNAKAGVK